MLDNDCVEKSHWSDEEKHREAELREESGHRRKKGEKSAVKGGDGV